MILKTKEAGRGGLRRRTAALSESAAAERRLVPSDFSFHYFTLHIVVVIEIYLESIRKRLIRLMLFIAFPIVIRVIDLSPFLQPHAF